MMDIQANWSDIRKHFNKSYRSNFHVSIASVDENNTPSITPVGTLFLNGNQTGFYFEKYISTIPHHAKTNKSICIMGVNSGRWFWIKSLFKGKFERYPAVRLYGILKNRRKATEKELNRLARRMRITKGLKGHTYLWNSMPYVREIEFTEAKMVNIGKMTEHL